MTHGVFNAGAEVLCAMIARCGPLATDCDQSAQNDRKNKTDLRTIVDGLDLKVLFAPRATRKRDSLANGDAFKLFRELQQVTVAFRARTTV